MTKNLIELSKLVLNKFTGPNGSAVSGKLSRPEDLEGEIRGVDGPGGTWGNRCQPCLISGLA